MPDWEAHARRTIARLGDDWTLRPASGAPAYIVRGVFSAAGLTVAEEGRGGVAVSQPGFRTMAADVAGAAVGDAIERGDSAYTIALVPPAEAPSGLITLHLERKEQ